MAKNKVQFQTGYSLFEFIKDYGTEEQCHQALYKWRWPTGFVCPDCGSKKHCILNTRRLYQCYQCHHQTSVTSQTIFEQTKLPLPQWFLAIHLITQAKTGISALSLKRQIGVSYNTAWSMKHKIMQVMKERDDSKPLTGVIQLDDAYLGGERHGGKRGRGSANKVPFVAAVSIDKQGHPIAMNFNVVKGFRLNEISRWAKQHIAPDSTIISDGLSCFSAVKEADCYHLSIVTGGGPESVSKKEFAWVNTMLGNVKNAITGTYHSINPKHAPRYLAEFCYRHNRRFQLEDMIPRFGYMAVRTPPMPGKFLKLAEAYG